MITVLAGGVGAARLLAGLVQVVDPSEVTAVVNVADDTELHGLHVSPDLDTVTYTLAGAIDPHRGWGLDGESWAAMDALDRYDPGRTWFRLGDRDLATHLYRTARLAEGAPLSAVAAEVAAAWGLGLRVLPVTDDRLRTMVTLAGDGEQGGQEVEFQEYFVRRRHAVPVSSVRIDGADRAKPGPRVLEAIAGADTIVVAPSNPIVSIGPLLALAELRDAVAARRDRTVAVSPIVAGAALKGPADRLMAELGHEPSVVGVARLYAELASVLVVDEADAELAGEVEALGLRCVVVPTIMSSPERAAALARTVVEALE